MDWLDLLAVQGALKSLLQDHSSKALILQHSAFFIVQLSHPYKTTGKTIASTRWTFICVNIRYLFFSFWLTCKKHYLLILINTSFTLNKTVLYSLKPEVLTFYFKDWVASDPSHSTGFSLKLPHEQQATLNFSKQGVPSSLKLPKCWLAWNWLFFSREAQKTPVSMIFSTPSVQRSPFYIQATLSLILKSKENITLQNDAHFFIGLHNILL